MQDDERSQYHSRQGRVHSIALRSLQRALGGEINGGQVLCPGPGHSLRDRSLAVRPVSHGVGFMVFSHAGDDWRACCDYVRERLGLPQWRPGDGRDRRVSPQRLATFDCATIDAESERRERTEDDWLRIKRAHVLWSEATDPRGTAAEQYLRSRALTLADGVAGNVLRYHPRCPWRNEDTGDTDSIPALLAAFTSIDDNTVTAVHRIRLDHPERWPKAERRMLGVLHRSAVQLDPAGEVLAIGEGIETALAARQLGHKPAWALGSVGMIAKLPLIDGVNTLRILGETGDASAHAIKQCGSRWHRAGCKVQIVMPDVGSDLNDELMKAATA
jgi:putative DNA primase/helicase